MGVAQVFEVESILHLLLLLLFLFFFLYPLNDGRFATERYVMEFSVILKRNIRTRHSRVQKNTACSLIYALIDAADFVPLTAGDYSARVDR